MTGGGDGGIRSAPTQSVLIVDLREDYAALMTAPTIEDFVRDRLRREGGTSGAWDKVVLIDDSRALGEHLDAFQRFLSQPLIPSLLVIAVGEADPENLVALRIPAMLADESGAVLWVGDEVGIPWTAGGRPQAIVRAGPSEGFPSLRSGLDDLVDPLRIEDVFDRVIGEAQRLGVPASPGVRLVSSRLDEATIARAEELAVRSMAVVTDDAGATSVELANLLRRADSSVQATLGGSIEASQDRAVKAIDEAQRRLDDLRSAGGARVRSGTARGAVVAAGRALGQFREDVAAILTAIVGAERQARQILLREGLRVHRTAAEEPLGDQVAGIARAAILGGHSPATIAEHMLHFAMENQIAPPGGRFEPVRSACPAAIVERLSGPPQLRFGWAAAHPLVLALALAAGLFGGLWAPYSLPIGAVVVLILIGGTAEARRRLARAVGAGRSGWGGVMLVAGCGVLGVALAQVLRSDHIAALAASALAVALAVVIPLVWWRLAVERWTRGIPLAEAYRATRALSVALQTRGKSIVLGDVRRDVVDTARMCGLALGELVGEFELRGAKASARSGHQFGRQRVPAALASLIRDDLAMVAARSLESARLAASGEVGRWPDALPHVAASELDAYHHHLLEVGLHRPPPGWPADDGTRAELADRCWQSTNDLGAALKVGGDAPPVTQLCSTPQVRLLDPAWKDGAATVIRFGPQVGQQSPAADNLEAEVKGEAIADAHQVVWTRSGALAGVIQLLPLRESGIQKIVLTANG